MAYFGIAVSNCRHEASVLRIVRQHATEPIADLRAKLGSLEPVVIFDEWDYPIGMFPEEGLAAQHQKVLEVFAQIQEAGGSPQLLYWVTKEREPLEVVSLEIAKNLFQAHVEEALREHD